MDSARVKFEPKLNFSQLSFRIGLARKRLTSYPLDQMDFLLTNLERPELCTSHAHWWTGDLSGRVLEALTLADGIDGKYDERLDELFSRILRFRQPNGLFGRYAQDSEPMRHEDSPISGSDKLFPALIHYFLYKGDYRALDAALGIGEYLLEHKNAWLEFCFQPDRPVGNHCWLIEPFAMLYGVTGDARYLDVIRTAMDRFGRIEGCHSHGFLTALRGMQRLALLTGDPSYNEMPERYRKMIRENRWESCTGDIYESFPFSVRNESCAVADWLMMNLYAAHSLDDDEAYAKSEHVLWNALYYNQIVTGGFGHRQMLSNGYGTSEFQEAWWCCTETSILALAEVARHTVTKIGDQIRINFLIPGTYTLNGVTVRIATGWPKSVDTIITIEGCQMDQSVRVRMPETVTQGTETRTQDGSGITIKLSGRIGYTIGDFCDKHFLRYGPLILAPSNYTWEGITNPEDNAIPGGYVSTSFPSMDFTLCLPEKDAHGFYSFKHDPPPIWTYFEEGPNSRTAVGRTSVNADIRFENGVRHTVRFWPLCENISTLTFYRTPILFNI